MLYPILRLIMKITVKVFFRKLHVRNAGNIPTAGPLIIVANHPSSFTDPIVIAVSIKRQVYFLAKGEVFKSAFAKWMLPKLHMIPIYRKQDDPSLLHKNEETFEKCHEHLENGGAILIFPEGVSITERKLKKVKTGTARIAMGVEAKNNFTLGVKIVSIGLNYTNPHKFREELLINIDKPITVSDLEEEYAIDPVAAVNNLTEQIRERLEKNIINIENEQLDLLVQDIETIYKRRLAEEMGYSAKEKEGDFLLTRGISETVHYFQEKDPGRVDKMSLRVRNYLATLERVGLSDRMLHRASRGGSLLAANLRSIFFIIAGFPFYIYGLVSNYLPYKIPGWVAKRMAKTIEFLGPIAMVLGTFTFLIFYTVQIWLVHRFFHNTWLTVAYGISLPLGGAFAYYYWHTVDYIRSRWHLVSLFWKRAQLIANLINERQAIVTEFDKAREEYMSVSVEKKTV
jgi:glycerol-3-phosphate O-acyltransferase / dihydroxyacetone phosphate acyltransferase